MGKILIKKGDLTKEEVDAVVNAANTGLEGGGGVDGAIHRVGGPEIMEECKIIRQKRGGISTGEAVATTAGNLKAKIVIHTAGPVWHGGNNGEERLLKHCYQNSLKVAEEHDCISVAFPNISTGVYGYPKEEAAEIAINAVEEYLESGGSRISEVRFVCFDDENYDLYRRILKTEVEGMR